jgi:hypothetical protein
MCVAEFARIQTVVAFWLNSGEFSYPACQDIRSMNPVPVPTISPDEEMSFHAEASPYARYKSHPEEITLVVPAGLAVVIPSLLMHGSHPNKDPRPRELVQLGYRPAWAGPIQPVEEWDERLVEAAPAIAKPFLKSLNTTGFVWEQQHKPSGMKTEAPGINPSRWGD